MAANLRNGHLGGLTALALVAMVGPGLAQPQEQITRQYTAPFHGKGVWQVVDGQGRVVGDVIGFSEFDGSAIVAFWHQPTRSAYTLWVSV